MTARKTEVWALVAEGLSDKAIGQRLGISEGTVAAHISQLGDRIGVDRTRSIRVQIAVAWHRQQPQAA